MGNEKKFLEKDLFEPVKLYLEDLGFKVQAEVKSCDIAAIKDEDLIIVELKTSFNLKLVYQALERKTITNNVYVSIPRPKSGQKTSAWKNMVRLLKQLDLGLLTVALDSETKNVEVIIEPNEGISRKNSKKKDEILKEISLRSGEYNKGGVNKTKIMTAYRERSIEIVCILIKKKQISAKELKELGLEGNVSSILNANYYGWFEKVEKGIFKLSKKGKTDLKSTEFKKLTDFYKKKYANLKN